MIIKGLKVLLTRPKGQQQELQQHLLQAGADVVSFPVLAIEPLSEQVDANYWQCCKQQCLRLDEFQHVIFISTNAVRHGFEWIEQYWPQLPTGIHWYAIGSTTAKALQQYGIAANVGDASMNSEALLQLPGLQKLSNEKVLIVRGIGGRDFLQQQLQKRGAIVDALECYRRSLPFMPEGKLTELIESQQFDVICLHSGESLQNFVHMLGDKIEQSTDIALLVPGQRVAAMAKEQGFKTVIVADNASSAGIISALEQYSLF
jgi:uroporphyrinogen-III synthase